MTVAEGGTATFEVSLAAAPLGQQVTVSLASDDTAAAAVAPTDLTFTAATWDAVQTVTVTGADDDDARDESAVVTL